MRAPYSWDFSLPLICKINSLPYILHCILVTHASVSIFLYLPSFCHFACIHDFFPPQAALWAYSLNIFTTGIALLLINFYGRQTQYFEDFSFLLRERFFATVYFRIFPKAAIVFSNPLHLSADVLLC